MRRARARARAGSSGFTLLEIIIALGVLAIGATTALALLVAATSTGRRAEHLVNSALVADAVLSDVETDLNGSFGAKDLEKLDVVSKTERRSSDFGDGPIRAAPYLDPRNVPKKKPAAKPSPRPSPSPKGKPLPSPTPRPGGSDAPDAPPPADRAFDSDPFADAKTYYYEKDKQAAAYPEYRYDVMLTPIGGPPDEPWEFLVEVVVRWSEKGAHREAVYQTVFLKKLQWLDVKPQ